MPSSSVDPHLYFHLRARRLLNGDTGEGTGPYLEFRRTLDLPIMTIDQADDLLDVLLTRTATWLDAKGLAAYEEVPG